MMVALLFIFVYVAVLLASVAILLAWLVAAAIKGIARTARRRRC